MQAHLANLIQQVENTKKELLKPFSMEKQLIEKSDMLNFLEAELSIDDTVDNQEPSFIPEVASAKTKPSILDNLKANTDIHNPTKTRKEKNIER